MATNRPAIKMKVPVATLLENARRYRDVLVEEGDTKMNAYVTDLAAYRKQAANALYAAALKAGATTDLDVFEWSEAYIGGRYRSTGITIEVGPKPEKPDVVDRDTVDRDIAILAATSDEFLTLTVEDNFARYLRTD